jgi:hypothetical protein
MFYSFALNYNIVSVFIVDELLLNASIGPSPFRFLFKIYPLSSCALSGRSEGKNNVARVSHLVSRDQCIRLIPRSERRTRLIVYQNRMMRGTFGYKERENRRRCSIL